MLTTHYPIEFPYTCREEEDALQTPRPPVKIRKLTPQEVEAFKVGGMYWCTSDDPCDAAPVYRISEITDPQQTTTLNILAHLCADHARVFAQLLACESLETGDPRAWWPDLSEDLP
jgi:hypothetical protein